MPRKNYFLQTVAGLALALYALSALSAQAGSFEDFTSERLAELKAKGQPVLVEVYAEWCSTCRTQSPILSKLLAEPEFSELTGLKLDWDDQRDAARELGAPRQSTLILFRDGEALPPSIGETNPDRLRDFLRLALN